MLANILHTGRYQTSEHLVTDGHKAKRDGYKKMIVFARIKIKARNKKQNKTKQLKLLLRISLFTPRD